MRDVANLKTRGFHKDVLSDFVSALEDEGLNVEHEWKKAGFLGSKKVDFEKVNVLTVSYLGKEVLLFQDDNLDIRMDNISEGGIKVIINTLKEKDILKKSSVLFAGFASGFHILLLLIVAVLGFLIGDAFLVGLAGFSMFFIVLGLVGLYFSVYSGIFILKIISGLIFMVGFVLAIPSSLLQFPIVKAICRKASEERLGV